MRSPIRRLHLIAGALMLLGLGVSLLLRQSRRPDLVHDLEDQGTAETNLGQAGQAIELYERALEVARSRGNLGGEAAVLGDLAAAYAELGQFEQAIEYFDESLTIAYDIGDRRLEANCLINLGHAYRQSGQMARAIGYYHAALVVAREIHDRGAEGLALGSLGTAYADLEKYEQAIWSYKAALEVARGASERESEMMWLGNLGSVHASIGQLDQAIEYYRGALTVAQEISGASTGQSAGWTVVRLDQSNWLSNLGMAYAQNGQPERAIAYYGEALNIAREIGGVSAQGSALWTDARLAEANQMGDLGMAYLGLGQAQQAIGIFNAALAIDREVGEASTQRPMVWAAAKRGEASQLSNLGIANLDLGQEQRAIEFFDSALAIHREVGGAYMPRSAVWMDARRGEASQLANLSQAYQVFGQVERAIEHNEQALAIVQEIGDHGAEGTILGDLGNTYAGLGELEQAIQYYEAALDVAREIGHRPNEGHWLAVLGLAYRDLEQAQRAQDHLEEALIILEETDPAMAEKMREQLAEFGD